MNKTGRDTLQISAVVDITTESLRAIVENGKELAGRDEKGRFKIDTADLAGEMISRFLMEKDFESYAADIKNYGFYSKRKHI